MHEQKTIATKIQQFVLIRNNFIFFFDKLNYKHKNDDD